MGTLPIRRPWLVLVMVLMLVVPAICATLRLPVRTSLTELLPGSKPSVVELRRVAHRLSGVSTLIVVAEGRDAESVSRFIDELAPRIRGLDKKYVTGVDEGNRAARRFFEAHRYLYAELSDLRELRDEIAARFDSEVAKRMGTDLMLPGDPPLPPLTRDALRARFGDRVNEAEKKLGRGYYLAEDGHLASIVVRTPFESADPRAFELEQKIRELTAEIAPQRWDATLRVLFTGNLVPAPKNTARSRPTWPMWEPPGYS